MYSSLTPNLMVTDVAVTCRFYQEILGFEMVASVPAETGSGWQFAILKKDSCSLMFQEKNNLVAEYPVLAAETLQPSVSLFINLEDFQETYEAVKSCYPIYTELHQTVYGTKEFAIVDNNGYVLTFAQARH